MIKDYMGLISLIALTASSIISYFVRQQSEKIKELKSEIDAINQEKVILSNKIVRLETQMDDSKSSFRRIEELIMGIQKDIKEILSNKK